MLDYYAKVAPVLLPHLNGRALTRVRFPDGVEGQRFFEKRAPKHTPDWVKTAPIEMGTAGVLDFIVCDDLPTLIWLAQLAAIELHPSLSLRQEARAANRAGVRPRPGAAGQRGRVRTGRPAAARAVRRARPRVLSRSIRARRASRSTFLSTPPPRTSRPSRTRGRSPRRSRSPSPTSSSPSRPRSCARARSSSTGARTTTRRPRSRSIRCAVASARRRRRR